MNDANSIFPKLLGVGLYSVPEAARFVSFGVKKRVPAQAIHRWLWGYRYRTSDGEQVAPPLWSPELPSLGDSRLLSFHDLVESLFVAVFRGQGVSLQTIRRIIQRAADLMDHSYPLSSLAFKTDGQSIVADLVDKRERRHVFDLDTGQSLLEIVFDRLRAGLEYSELLAARWWPMGTDRRVVIDPKRSFGRPIVSKEEVPTAALAGAFQAEGSIKAVTHWYGVSEQSVKDALEYESELAKVA